jgi:hypothetical protein
MNQALQFSLQVTENRERNRVNKSIFLESEGLEILLIEGRYELRYEMSEL